jgi:hypothetical protein
VTEKSSTDTLTQSPRTTIQAPADVVDADPHYSSNANLTQQRYQEVVRRLTGKGRIESPSDCHSTALRPRRRPRPNGFCVFDILESEKRWSVWQGAWHVREEVGITEPPRSFPAHSATPAPIERG